MPSKTIFVINAAALTLKLTLTETDWRGASDRNINQRRNSAERQKVFSNYAKVAGVSHSEPSHCGDSLVDVVRLQPP